MGTPHITVATEIVLAAQRGDVQAFEHIVLQYERSIYTFIYRMIGQSEDAEEITQETFIKIYTHIGTYNPKKNLGSWIFTIARRAVYDRLRKLRRERKRIILSEAEQLDDYQPNTPQTQEASAAQSIDLQAALRRLHPRHKEVLLLYYWHGFSYVELAHILSLPLNTVKSLLHRAKKAVLLEMST